MYISQKNKQSTKACLPIKFPPESLAERNNSSVSCLRYFMAMSEVKVAMRKVIH